VHRLRDRERRRRAPDIRARRTALRGKGAYEFPQVVRQLDAVVRQDETSVAPASRHDCAHVRSALTAV